MNYLSIYNNIVNTAKNSNRKKRSHIDKNYVYYERHHILPKCAGGTNDIGNLVLLTAREHFVAHQLLIKIYPSEYKLVFALRMLCRNGNTNHIRNNKEYEWIRKLSATVSSNMQKGKPSKGFKFQKGHTMSAGSKNGMYGHTHTNETKILQSNIAKQRDASVYDFLRVPKTESIIGKMQKTKQKNKYKLISPDNTEYIFNRIADASILCGISKSVLVKLAGNRYGFDHCRNWKCVALPIT